jgi:hypothetical protein
MKAPRLLDAIDTESRLSLSPFLVLCIYVLHILPQLEIVKINNSKDNCNKGKGSEMLRETGDEGQTGSQ